jgi:hypothetical protein
MTVQIADYSFTMFRNSVHLPPRRSRNLGGFLPIRMFLNPPNPTARASLLLPHPHPLRWIDQHRLASLLNLRNRVQWRTLGDPLLSAIPNLVHDQEQ